MSQAQLAALAAGNPLVAERMKAGHYDQRIGESTAPSSAGTSSPPLPLAPHAAASGGRSDAGVAALSDWSSEAHEVILEHHDRLATLEAETRELEAESAQLRVQVAVAPNRAGPGTVTMLGVGALVLLVLVLNSTGR